MHAHDAPEHTPLDPGSNRILEEHRDRHGTLVEDLGQGRYHIHWTRPLDTGHEARTPHSAPVRIFAGRSPETIDYTRELARDETGSVEIEIDEAPRYYFGLQAGDASPTVVASRNVALKGVRNFRDLGGYVADSGSERPRRVRWGVLYRSAHFAEPTDCDQARLRDLDLGLVFDLRTPQEREKRPSRLGDVRGIETLELPIDPGSGLGFREHLESGSADDSGLSQIMQDLNRTLVREHTEPYRRMFTSLLEGRDGAIAIQCTSGKDRTGLGAALLLLALGVARDSVLQDYALTTRYLPLDDTFQRALEDFRNAFSTQLSVEMLRPIYEARPEYLGAALDEIDSEFGGPQRYLTAQLGLEPSDLAHLRETFLD